MAGFPIIPSRDAFGPVFEDDGEVINPKTHVGAAQFNLWMWQMAGIGVTAARAYVSVAADGSVLAHGEVWNGKGLDQFKPTVTNPSAGTYVVTWGTTAPDENGTLQQVAFSTGIVQVQGPTMGISQADVAFNVVTVSVLDPFGSPGGPTNMPFVLEVR